MNHGAKEPRKGTRRLTRFRQKFDDTENPTRREGCYTFVHDRATCLFGIIMQNMPEEHGVIRTAKLHRT